MSVDLSQFDAALEKMESGIDVPILGMDGKLTGLSITVAGPDSERAQKARQELHLEDVDSERMVPFTAAELYARGTRYLAKITVGWSGPVKIAGEELTYSEANTIRVYERYRFIREQIDGAAGSRAGFFLASKTPAAKSSKPQ